MSGRWLAAVWGPFVVAFLVWDAHFYLDRPLHECGATLFIAIVAFVFSLTITVYREELEARPKGDS